jgi:Protein of unknown function (DUF3326)
MNIDNLVFRVPAAKRHTWLQTVASSLAEALPPDTYPLRFAIVEVAKNELVIEATIVRFCPDSPYAERLRIIEVLEPRHKLHQAFPFCVAQVVPTGLRCEIGGFAGDAGPATNLLAASADMVVTHPNAVNASELNEMSENVLYVEGKSLDDLLLGHVGLLPVAAKPHRDVR